MSTLQGSAQVAQPYPLSTLRHSLNHWKASAVAKPGAREEGVGSKSEGATHRR